MPVKRPFILLLIILQLLLQSNFVIAHTSFYLNNSFTEKKDSVSLTVIPSLFEFYPFSIKAIPANAFINDTIYVVSKIKDRCTTTTSTANVRICRAQLPYVWNGDSYNNGGAYTKVLINAAGCDSIATLNLTVNAIVSSTTNVTICASQLPYIWNGNPYNAGGTYNVALTGFGGCDSIAIINLIVKDTSSSSANISVCPSALPYTWNGNSYTISGTYTKKLINSIGCDSIAKLNLIVKSDSSSITNVSVCPTLLPYTWNGNSYNKSGTYTKTLMNAEGCDSFATLNLTVNSTLTSITNINVCSSSLPYIWNGISANTSGTYTKALVTPGGCDSIATLNLMVVSTLTSTINITICSNQLPYVWNGNSYNVGGTYIKTLTSAAGCDSIATLILIINKTSGSASNVTVCSSALPYIWNGGSYIRSGTYTKIFPNASGCDSTTTLVLNVKATTSSTTSVSVCPSSLPYIWNGSAYYTAGTFIKSLTNVAGCDSITTLKLIVNAVVSSTTDTTVCSSALPYIWNGSSYNTAGIYTKVLASFAGCDSTAVLNLFVIPPITSITNINVCPAQLPYSWNGTLYNAAGKYNKTFTSVAGCDSVATLNLAIVTTLTSTTDISVCPLALPYIWNGNSYSIAGTYTKAFITAAGCDSVATLNLFVTATLTSTTDTTVCSNLLPYSWNGNSYNTGGTFTKNFVNAAGCDSVATLNLNIKPAGTSTISASICPSQLPYSWNGNVYNKSGIYIKTFPNATGCDSIATLSLTVNANTGSISNIGACSSSLPYIWNGGSYGNSGIYIKQLVNAAGCDSIATLILSIGDVVTSTTNASICNAQLPYGWNGNLYITGGTYVKTLKSVGGCDSIATLNLIVNAVVSSTSDVSICPSQLPYLWNGNSYIAAGIYNVGLKGIGGCDSIATLVLNVYPNSVSTTNISVCPSALPYSWNGNLYNTAGAYQKVLINTLGCDSIAKLNLTVKPVAASIININICPAQLPYTWNGNSYNTAGTYIKKLVSATGCDSIATLNLAINSTITSTINISVCPSALPYVWNGKSYNTPDTYTKTFKNSAGCDSIATLILIINSVTGSASKVSVCPSALPYMWNGNSYSSTGVYTKTLSNSTGCDSIITLDLTIKITTSSATDISVCASALPYSWNGNSYSTAGTYTKTLVNAAGCDSIATLNLSVTSTAASITNKSVCTNQLPYVWNGRQLTVAGTYTVSLIGTSGCDSAATLVLSVISLQPVPFLGRDTSLCSGETLLLSAGIYDKYLWQDMSTSQTFKVSESGIYSVTVSNAQGCSGDAAISVSYLPNCDDIYFPNAITPNGDGLNDKFGAAANLYFVSKYYLTIYNRFGELVFSTNDPNKRWDGMFKGRMVDTSTFIWYADYIFKGKRKSQKGYLVVIR